MKPPLLPGMPQQCGEPVFAEPWQAQAFAMTLALHGRGLFSWPEWAEALSQQIAAAQTAGDADLGDTYYRHWLAALEALVAAKGASSAAELARYRQAWDHAATARRTASPSSCGPRTSRSRSGSWTRSCGVSSGKDRSTAGSRLSGLNAASRRPRPWPSRPALPGCGPCARCAPQAGSRCRPPWALA